MSPEQAMGQADIDHRSDIYALGALAYEMLVGTPPFDEGTPQAILSAHVLEPPADVRDKRPDTPPELAAFVMRCLQKKPDDRWQSAEEIVPRLEALATPSGGLTPTYTRPVRASPGRRRPSWLVAAVVVAILAVGGVAAALLSSGGSGSGKIEMIAVLPFLDLSGTDQAFVDAVHDAVITRLGGADMVGVVSRTAVMRYRGTTRTTEEIADELGVQAVVEGTTFRDGDRMRVNVQMVDPVTLRQLWGNVYERDVDDVIRVQGDVADSIAADLRGALRVPDTASAPAGEEPRP
jgi:serine/threonine-protein kinase